MTCASRLLGGGLRESKPARVGSGKGAKAPGRDGFSSRQVHEPTTEGARAMRVGVALLRRCCVAIRRDASRREAPVRRKPNLALIRWSSTGLAPPGAPGCKPRRPQSGQATRQCSARLASSGHYPVGIQPHRSTSRGRPRGASIGVRGDPRLCSGIVEIAEVKGAAPVRHAQARSEGARRRWKALWMGEVRCL